MPISRQWFKGALIAGMFLYGVIAVSTIMPLIEIVLGRRAAVFHERIRMGWNRTVCGILGLHLEVSGEPSQDALLLVANHISWLDIIALGSQQPMTFVAKREVADWPVMGYLARRIGTLFVSRGDVEQTAAVAEQMAWQLRQGKRLMLFPEGTTTTGERVLRFHAKLLHPAQLAQVPVQAIGLEYLGEARSVAPFIGEDEFLPHLLSILKLDRVHLRVHYCPPLPAGPHRDILAQTTRKQVVAALFRKSTDEGRKVGGL